ncbi:MAG: class I SAM-dependent methyltransferase [Planctomycetota bacterium]
MKNCESPVSGNTGNAQLRGKDSNSVHTFGVSNYDEYWRARGMHKSPREAHRRMEAALLKLRPPPARVLELGPGPGHLFALLQTAGYDMYAVDASKTAIECLKAPPNQLRLADLNDGLPDFGVRFQAIIGAMVLHHITEPGAFLARLRTTLEPGGFLILTIPNIITLRNRLRFLAGKFPKLSASHRNFMTPHEATELLRQSGFNVLQRLSARRKFLNATIPILFSNELALICRTAL